MCAARAKTEQPEAGPVGVPDERAVPQADRATKAIEEMIIRGTLQPGSRMHEPKLATILGVSRGSIREALHRLEGKHLVVRTPNQGASVASLSPVDLIELLELREAIEGMACRLAAENMSDSEIDKLEGMLSGHDVNGGYFQEAGDVDFHFAIAHGSRNKRLAEAITGDLYHLLRIYRYKSSTLGERAAASAAEHARILAAIRDRDPDRAETLMRLHVRRSRENLQKREFAAIFDSEKAAAAPVERG